MAPSPAGHSSLSSLTGADGRAFTQIVVVSTASTDAIRWAARAGGPVTTVPGHEGVPLIDPLPGMLFVHGVPDVFGRVLDPPSGWETLVLRHRVMGAAASDSPFVLDVGEPSAHPPGVLTKALGDLHKQLMQQRGVRPLFTSPPALGLPYIAPSGISLPGGFGRIERPLVAGLPELVVVRPDGDPSRR